MDSESKKEKTLPHSQFVFPGKKTNIDNAMGNCVFLSVIATSVGNLELYSNLFLAFSVTLYFGLKLYWTNLKMLTCTHL